MVQLPACSYFQNDIDMGFVVEISVHFDDIGVAEIHLNLQLPDELLSDLLFLEQPFFYHLQSTYESRIFLSK